MLGREPMILHYVYNMERATRFYTTVFDTAAKFESPGWTTLDFGPLEVALHILAPGHEDEAPLPHAGLSFLVDSIESMQERIEAAGGELVELREPDSFVPVRVASFRDCEGNGFELRQEP